MKTTFIYGKIISLSYESGDLVTIAFLLFSYKVKIKLVAHKLFYKHPKK